MKNIFFIFLKLLAILVFGSVQVQAELKLDNSVTQEQVLQAIRPMQKETIWPWAAMQTFEFEKYVSIPYRPNFFISEDEKSVFPWVFNGRRYYSYIVQYVPNTDPLEGCENYRSDDINWHGPNCYWANKRELFCRSLIFMMTEQGEIAGIGLLQIGRGERLIKGKPICHGVKAMTVSNEIEDSMFVTMGYIGSASTTAPGIHPQEYSMTVLMRFKQEPDGKLNITQDDRCLPNPNRIANIAQANKVLKANRCMK